MSRPKYNLAHILDDTTTIVIDGQVIADHLPDWTDGKKRSPTNQGGGSRTKGEPPDPAGNAALAGQSDDDRHIERLIDLMNEREAWIAEGKRLAQRIDGSKPLDPAAASTKATEQKRTGGAGYCEGCGKWQAATDDGNRLRLGLCDPCRKKWERHKEQNPDADRARFALELRNRNVPSVPNKNPGSAA